MEINKCESETVKKNETLLGKQRYQCKECEKTFLLQNPNYSKTIERKVILMYLNNVGIREIALFAGGSRATTMLNWIKETPAKKLDRKPDEMLPTYCEKIDIIELGEIYTFTKNEL